MERYDLLDQHHYDSDINKRTGFYQSLSWPSAPSVDSFSGASYGVLTDMYGVLPRGFVPAVKFTEGLRSFKISGYDAPLKQPSALYDWIWNHKNIVTYNLR
ncbi:hypothetical protein PAMP_018899 [Pampus punctatissimus]